MATGGGVTSRPLSAPPRTLYACAPPAPCRDQTLGYYPRRCTRMCVFYLKTTPKRRRVLHVHHGETSRDSRFLRELVFPYARAGD